VMDMSIDFGGDTDLGTIDTVLRKFDGWILEVEHLDSNERACGAYDGLDREAGNLRLALWDDQADAVSTSTVSIPIDHIRTITIL
jgi:hypothetical protein